MDKIIHSSRLQLIVTPLSFMEPVMQLENHPEHKRFIMPYDKNRHRQCLRSSDEMHLSIVNFHGKFLGFIILAGLNSFSRSMEFRRIVVADRGKGIGRECLQLICRYCFEIKGFHKLWLDVFEDNERAIKLYVSAGFQQEGRLRDEIHGENGFRSLLIFSMLEDEYFAQKLN